tara:strand:+ start:2365 stop:2889 length:525 start_codon:yes stop_codon:yes gene_type:complete
MPCTITITGRAFPCKTGIGGIKKVYACAWTDGLWDPIVAGGVADATIASTEMFSFELTKNSGSLQQTVTSSVENGTVFYSQVVTMIMPLINGTSNDELRQLMSARVALLVEDNNGNLLLMGHALGCEVSGGDIGTGTAKGDLNGYNIQFTAEETAPAPIVPTSGWTNLTLTAGS